MIEVGKSYASEYTMDSNDGDEIVAIPDQITFLVGENGSVVGVGQKTARGETMFMSLTYNPDENKYRGPWEEWVNADSSDAENRQLHMYGEVWFVYDDLDSHFAGEWKCKTEDGETSGTWLLWID